MIISVLCATSLTVGEPATTVDREKASKFDGTYSHNLNTYSTYILAISSANPPHERKRPIPKAYRFTAPPHPAPRSRGKVFCSRAP